MQKHTDSAPLESDEWARFNFLPLIFTLKSVTLAGRKLAPVCYKSKVLFQALSKVMVGHRLLKVLLFSPNIKREDRMCLLSSDVGVICHFYSTSAGGVRAARAQRFKYHLCCLFTPIIVSSVNLQTLETCFTCYYITILL